MSSNIFYNNEGDKNLLNNFRSSYLNLLMNEDFVELLN